MVDKEETTHRHIMLLVLVVQVLDQWVVLEVVLVDMILHPVPMVASVELMVEMVVQHIMDLDGQDLVEAELVEVGILTQVDTTPVTVELEPLFQHL